MMMPTQAPAGIHREEKPALAAYSAPAMKVPEPIQVHMRVKTITRILRLLPATIKSSWVFTLLARRKLSPVSRRK